MLLCLWDLTWCRGFWLCSLCTGVSLHLLPYCSKGVAKKTFAKTKTAAMLWEGCDGAKGGITLSIYTKTFLFGRAKYSKYLPFFCPSHQMFITVVFVFYKLYMKILCNERKNLYFLFTATTLLLCRHEMAIL